MHTHSFLDTQEPDVVPSAFGSQTDRLLSIGHFESNIRDGNLWCLENSKDMKNTKVIMGIMHSTRPHYGVQVCCIFMVLFFCCWVLILRKFTVC